MTMFIGSFGLFLTMFLLFVRFMPAIAISEVKGVTKAADPHHHDDHSPEGHDAHAPAEEAAHVA
jgi:molybdopterin-containing oxidoreductase family membrane subunit